MKELTKEERELLTKYREKLAKEFGMRKIEEAPSPSSPIRSVNYLDFKRENLPKHLSIYEKLCNFSGRIVKVNPDKKSEEKLRQAIELCHLETTPGAAFSLSLLVFIAIFVVFGLVGFLFSGSIMFFVYSLVLGLVILLVVLKVPELLGNNWRLKASNQMVQCIFYLVTYMRHTSNLELAVRFASEHLSPPLSLDLKKVLWDVETAKYETVQESLDTYLKRWNDYNPEFTESVHLIEGSLYESSEQRRLSMIDKSLDVMLQETYEKMLRYTHDLKGPITMLYMMGIILPILGLVILPLVASFMTTDSSPMKVALVIALLYNIALPAGIFYMARMVLSKRPTGYGETDLSEQPSMKKLRNLILHFGKKEVRVSPLLVSITLGTAFLLIGLTPLFLGYVLSDEALLGEPALENFFHFKILGYRQQQGTENIIGPYGLGATLLSFLIVLGVGVGIGLYFKLRSSNVIKIRENVKTLETEFASALFQLGNRLGDGLPLEIAFSRVAEVTKETPTGKFFAQVDNNIRNRGVSVDEALFNKQFGAITLFPSNVIESSMKVLLESSKKGPKVASVAMMNVSEYIKDIHRVDERLRDLLAEIISDMKQQIKVLAPAIAGIVVGITAMIVSILGKLTDQMATIAASSGAGASVPTGLMNIFGDGVPTYFFQTIVGIYIVEIIYVMTVMVNGVENGADKLAERYQLGDNLTKSTIIYSIIAIIVTVMFTVIATSVMNTVTTT